MSPERDDYEEEEEEEEYEEEEEEPRSIFASLWFRAALAVLVLAVVGVLALPYVQEYLGSSSKPPVTADKPSEPPVAKPPAQPTPSPAVPAAPAPPKVAEKPAAPAAPAAPTPAPKVAEKPAEKAAEPASKPAAPAAPAPAPQVAAKPPEKPAAKPAPSKGDYWVQVGAFGDAKNAGRLADRLTEQKYSVQQAKVTRGAASGGGNEVFVAGAKQRDVYDKVKDKGYHVDAVKGGAVVRPPLPLKDAVALSKELADAGMDVKIRRVGGEKATFHLVRVGGFADRKEAVAAQKELAGKGVSGFIVKGAPR
ncbi:MAG: SPOR domain-containing protein [Candidatus Rokubacteria bacterium]|nr:SPOR domain-containing protein [Candidatus Rokubacteria bacterium]